jgi:hypothetical protein
MEIKYSERAAKQIKQISKGDKKSTKMILPTIEEYTENLTRHFDIKVLKGFKQPLDAEAC